MVTLDISGNVNVSNNLYVSNLGYFNNIVENIERINVDDISFNLDYSKASTFYLGDGNTISGNMTLNIQNLPSIIDLSHSYSVNAVYDVYSSGTPYYGNNITVNTGNNIVNASSVTPNYVSTIPTFSGNCLVSQNITYYCFEDISYVISNITVYPK